MTLKTGFSQSHCTEGMTVSSQVKAETVSGLYNSSRACFLLNIDVSAWFDQPFAIARRPVATITIPAVTFMVFLF